MRTIDATRPHNATRHCAGGPSVASDDAPLRRPSPRLIADAVIAGYIHDISHASRRGSSRQDSSRQLTAQSV